MLLKHWQHTSFYLFACDVSSQTERLSNASVPVGAALPHTDRLQPQHFRHLRRPPSQAETLALPRHLTLCLFAAGHQNLKARPYLIYPNQKCRQPVMSFWGFFSVSSSKIGTRWSPEECCAVAGKGQIKNGGSLLLTSEVPLWVCFRVRKLRWELNPEPWQAPLRCPSSWIHAEKDPSDGVLTYGSVIHLEPPLVHAVL